MTFWETFFAVLIITILVFLLVEVRTQSYVQKMMLVDIKVMKADVEKVVSKADD